MQRRTSLAILAVAGSAALVAGCGSGSSGGGGGTATNDSSQTPAAELSSGFSALGQASTLTTTIKLGATAGDISSLAASHGTHLTSQQANTIAGAQIAVVVSAPSGKTLSDLSGGNTSGSAVDFTISDNGTNFLSIRSVNKTIYAQVDLKDVLNAIGQGAAYAQLQAASSQLPEFAQALLAGKWVSLPQSAASSLTGTSGTSSPSPQQEQALISALKGLLTKDVTVKRTSTGSTDQLTLTANSKTLVTDFISDISSAVPTAGAALSQADTSKVPDKTVTLNASVTNGAVSQITFDLGQFDTKGQAHLPLVVNFSQNGATISAPSGAVPVNTQELGQLLQSFTGGLSSGG